MTNKRKHKLERIIRYEYSCFNTMIYPKECSKKLLQQVENLLTFKITCLWYTRSINAGEKYFMQHCNTNYYIYYNNLY